MVTCTEDCEGECGDVCPVILANKELIKFKEENERLKRLVSDLTGNSITSYSDAIEYTKIRKERDSLKQINSELVEKINNRKATVIELINYGDPKDRVKWEYALRELKMLGNPSHNNP